MIPKITHSRSKLFSYLNDFEDGASVFGISSDTYPDLFEIAHPDIVAKAPKGWKPNKTGSYRYLWFPPDSMNDEDLEAIADWRDRFEHYVLIGLNKYIATHFSNELDFCLALDFNYDAKAEKRTLYGEAEYQLKYQHSRPHLNVLRAALKEAFSDLPIPAEEEDNNIVVSCVPSNPEMKSVAKSLAAGVASALDMDFLQSDLLCEKREMKGLSVEEKIPEWQDLFADEDCIELHGDVEERTVVIIDDLYQSGATMWCYAEYLKSQGAKYVLGLPCVKSLRDSDNQ